MLFMVVLLAIVPLAGRFAFVSTVMLVLPAGTMVLLQNRYTHYPLRGGTSHHGVNCGAFSVGASADIYTTIWDRGVALSFKTSTYYASRGDRSDYGMNCGISCVNVKSGFNIAGWYFDAALLLN